MTRDNFKVKELIAKIRFDKNMFDKSIEHLGDDVAEISKIYGYEEKDVIKILRKRLTASNMSTEACITAIGFLILEGKEENFEKDLDRATKNQILNSAIFFANGEGIDPTECLTLK